MTILPTQAQRLKQLLKSLPDKRKARGLRHQHSTILQIVLGALLSGARSYLALADWAQACSQNVLKRLGARFDPASRRYVPPAEATIRRVCQAAELEPTEAALNGWLNELALAEAETGEAIAIDGKTLKGSRNAEGQQSHLLSACLHQSGVTVAQCQVHAKTNEIPLVPTLLAPLSIAGRVVTADALPTQRETATYLVEEKRPTMCSLPRVTNRPYARTSPRWNCTTAPRTLRRWTRGMGGWKSGPFGPVPLSTSIWSSLMGVRSSVSGGGSLTSTRT